MRNPLRQFFKFIDKSLVKIFTQRRHKVAFVVFSIGLTMIISSHLVPEKPYLIHTVLLEVGIACIIAAIAEFVLLEHAIKIFKEEVRHDIKIVSHCEEHQLVDIMPPRKHAEDVAIQEINSAIENAQGDICVIAFILRDIMNSNTLLLDALKRLLARDAAVTVKLLLIDPTSDAARIRVMAEEGSSLERSTLRNAFWSNSFDVNELTELAAKKERFHLEARFYDVLPNFFMISTPKEVFIEPYHLGRNTASGTPNRGTVPLLRFSANSQMYDFAKAHFSYIWGNPPANGEQQGAGYIRIRTIGEVIQKIDRRFDDSEGRPRGTERRRRKTPLRSAPLVSGDGQHSCVGD